MKHQATSQTATSQTTSKKLFFTQPDLAVVCDTKLCKTAKDLYHILVAKRDPRIKGTYIVTKPVSLSDLAVLINRTPRTVCIRLNELIDAGIINVEHTYSSKKGWKLANKYILIGRHAARYAGSPYAHPPVPDVKKITNHTEKNFASIIKRESIDSKESLRTTLKGEAETSQTIGNIPTISEEAEWEHEVQEETSYEAPKAPEGVQKSPAEKRPSIKAEVDLTGVPDIMLPTARYWLHRTGHTSLTDGDKKVLKDLANTQYPTYVNKAIDKAVERFLRLGNPLSTLHLGYIAKCLSGHQTYNPDQKPAKGNKRGTRKAAKVQSVQEVVPNARVEQEAVVEAESIKLAAPVEVSAPVVPAAPLAMPVEEAERVIAEHEAEQPVHVELPPALVELHKAIEVKNQEVIDERMSQLPQDEFGAILPEDDEEVEKIFEGIGVQEYLRVKFPDATNEELNTEHLSSSDQSALEQAKEIDKACALCSNSINCGLPAGCDKTHARPVAMLKPDLRGRMRVTIGYGGCVKCKHDCASCKPDPEFERMVKVCGLSPKQKEQTFAAYDHAAAGAEAIVAKAMAIRAARDKTNLVLGGKAGTGKTHLATAIAIEAMKNGRQAIVKTVPDLMDELISANRNNTDPFGLMMKYKTVPCLVLDDLGKQTNTEAVWKYLYQLVNYRYYYGLQTIVTTNAYDMSGLMRKWNEDKVEPVMSRILENGEWVTISTVENYRMKRCSHVCEEETTKDIPAELAVAETVVEPERAEPVIENSSEAMGNCHEAGSHIDEVVSLPAVDWTQAFSRDEEPAEPPARPKHYTEEEWYLNLSVVDKVAVQMARYQKHVAEQEAKLEISNSTTEVETEAPTPTPEEQSRMKAEIDAWLDEQCESADMSDEEIDAMVDEAIEADKQPQAPAEKPEAPQHGGTVIHVPQYDDGLDDDEEDLRLYGGLYSK